MKKRLTLCVSLTLAVILGVNSLLVLASPAYRPPNDSLSRTSRVSYTKSEVSKPARLPFSSKLLSKRPQQNGSTAGSLPGQSSTLLPDGRLLKIGGLDQDGPVVSAIIEDSRGAQSGAASARLQRARAWHTATILPDGNVLIVGGVGANGQVVETVEVFKPETNTSEILSHTGITPRVYHTATLLTEALVLIAGGLSSKGDALRNAQLWDYRTRAVTTLQSKLKTARYNHAATLLANGKVLLSSGSDKDGAGIENDELYDPGTQRFTKADPRKSTYPHSSNLSPQLAASLPEDGAVNVPLDAVVAFRFSQSLQVNTVNADTVTLYGPYGRVETRVVPAEGGMLAFVTPQSALFAGSTYTVSLSGPTDIGSLPLVSTTISFTTAIPRAPIEVSDDEDWIPNASNLQGDWRSERPDSEWQSLAALKAPPGVTALAGKVLTLNGQPLDRVTLRIGERTAQTDNTGRFLLDALTPGHHELLIDGRSASRAGKTYGVFEAGVDIEPGQTNVLPYTIWMTKIDMANAVAIPSPTTTEVVITTPRIPGMEVRIPAHTIIRDHDGNVVRKVSITAIPVDRPPFPLPVNVDVPIYFTVQPGGAYIETRSAGGPGGARIIYPNYKYEPGGARVNFWNYDAEERGWYVYGQGTVTGDGKQVVPDPGVAVYEFTGAMINAGLSPPTSAPAPGSCAVDGDPVDLGTGLFVYQQTDLVLPDILPISLSRTYRPQDSNVRPFGIGTMHPYAMFLWSANQYQEADLILPDGGRIHYVRISAGTGFADAVFEHTATPTAFYKSTLKWNGGGWDLTLKDGLVYVFGENAPLQSIRDRYGNTITLTRTGGANGNINQITSPSGRWLKLTYDASNRLTQATDNIGRAVNYTYDASGRLWKVTDPMGGVTEYTYDSSHRMLTIKNPRGIVYVTNEYDANGRVSRQTHADGGVYQFAYTLDGNGKVTQTDVTDPRGNHRIVTFNSSGYVLTDTRTCCTGSITNERQTGTNIITSITDQVGHRTEFGHDAMGNVTSITRGAGTAEAVTITYTFESTFNQLASATDPLGHSVSFAYGGAGNITGATDQLGNTYLFSYNTAGQVISINDPLNSGMQFVYDGGDLVSGHDPLGSAGTAFMDSAGRLLAVTGPLGEITRYEYDALDRLTRITDPLQGATQYPYDPDSNLVSITDARGAVTNYAYDNMDRLVTRTDPLSRVESYQYDLNGNLTQVTDRKNQVTTYTYDALNRLTQVQYGDLSTTTYTYDVASRLTQVVDSISGTINYGYDTLDRVTSEATPQGTVSYTYDSADRRTSTTVPGQTTINYTYDSKNRLTQITQGSATVTISYDAVGRATSLTLPNGVVTQYSYDAASKLTGINYTKGGLALGNLTYAYDAAGERTAVGGRFARTSLPQSLGSTSYNAGNQQTAFGTQNLTYDLNGNLASDGTNTYTWNARNELASMTGPGLSASFQFDGFGRRISKALNGTITSFLYDGENVVQEQVGGVASANMLVGGLDAVFIRSDSSGSSSLLADPLGSTIALTDSSGAVQTQYTYEPFGKTTSSGPNSSNSSQFTARENDGTGLYYYRARYYNPQLGRFLSEDPLGFAAGVNFYAYVGDNPVNSVDPEGLDIVSVCCKPLEKLSWLRILKIWRHCYIQIHTDSDNKDHTWGILGNEGSTKNQIPRKDDNKPGRNSGGDCKPARGYVTTCEIEKLKGGLDAAVAAKSCPACGANYQFWFARDLLNLFDGFNSNTWAYNMLEGAGLTPPAQARAPGYHTVPGKWY